jgi:hypothetical protein
MNYYIKIKNGQPFEWPIAEDNFIQVFPEEDINNLSENFAKFIRHDIHDFIIENPDKRPGYYQIYEEKYVKNGDAWEDKWTIRDMTEKERQEKISIEIHTAFQFKEGMIKFLDEEILLMEDELQKKVFTNYRNKLNNFVITDPNPEERKYWPIRPSLVHGHWYPFEYTQ